MPNDGDPSGGSRVLTTAGRQTDRPTAAPAGHTLYLPPAWERRPCSAACSPGAPRETLPYTSREAGSPWRSPPPSSPCARAGLGRADRSSRTRAGGGDPPAKAVRSGVSGPAGSSGLPRRRCPGERSRQPRAPQPRRRGSPAALAGPAECHQRRSKGKGPAEGEAGGPTAHDPRRLPGQGRRAQRGGGDAATGRPAPGQ